MRRILGLFLALAACSGPPAQEEPADGWKAYERGDFEQAQTKFQRAGDAHGLGRLRLQQLDFAGARKHLLPLKANEALADLALSYLLEGDFVNAQEVYAAIKDPKLEGFLKLLESFEGKAPYQIDMAQESVTIPMTSVDPLPIVEVEINGEGPYYFFIDTGAAEIFIDRKVCQRVGIRMVGKQTGTFAGGVSATLELARVRELSFGDVKIRELPASVMDIEGFSTLLRHPVHGIIGTHVLMRFLSTLDYKGERLILRRRGSVPPDGLKIPIVMVGDHFILARGKLNRSPILWFIDTGLVGAGLTATARAIQNAGITISGPSQPGQGGGGAIQLIAFKAESVSLGELTRANMMGFAGAFPPSLETRYRVRIEGILSHLFFRPGSLTFDFEKMQLIYRE